MRRYLREIVDDRQVTGDMPRNLKRDKRGVFSSFVAALGTKQDNARLTLDEVFGNMSVCLLAGHEASWSHIPIHISQLLTYLTRQDEGPQPYSVLSLMAPEPEEQERLCALISETFEDHFRPDRILAVLYETLHLFAGVLLIPKTSVNDQYFMINSAFSKEDMANPAVKDKKDQQKRLLVHSGSHIQISVVGLDYNEVAVDSTRFQEVAGEPKFDRRARLMNAVTSLSLTPDGEPLVLIRR
ncbi:hypothetical protein FRB98_002544 [Tulasnella sp. 332]|nr:hypothetical protein FRB98_002544 [Tulasnella sp. 332]